MSIYRKKTQLVFGQLNILQLFTRLTFSLKSFGTLLFLIFSVYHGLSVYTYNTIYIQHINILTLGVFIV